MWLEGILFSVQNKFEIIYTSLMHISKLLKSLLYTQKNHVNIQFKTHDNSNILANS